MKLSFPIIALYAFLLSSEIKSQDLLYKKDNSKYEVKITEITSSEVKYKLQSNPNGPLYVINKTDIAIILYQNGKHETFPEVNLLYQMDGFEPSSRREKSDSLRAQRKRLTQKKFMEVTKTKNALFINTLALINSCVSVSFMREFGKGLFSAHVPVSFSFDEPYFAKNYYRNTTIYNSINGFKLSQKSIDVGLGVYFHAGGKKAVTNFVGPLIRFAQYNGSFYSKDFYIDQNGSTLTYGNYKIHGFVLNEFYMMINNGLLFRISNRFNLMVNTAIGFTAYQHFVANNPLPYAGNNSSAYSNTSIISSPAFHLGFYCGYRF